MNEQQLADLLSEQVDQLLAGQSPPDFQGPAELSELLTLGQEMSQLSFQPGPAAQAAFQAQLTGWFGAPGGGLATILPGTPKTWLVSFVAAVTLVGAGLGLIGLLRSDSPRVETEESIEAPVTVELLATNTPLPTEAKEAASPEATAEPGPPSGNGSTVKDSLPTAAPSLGDTLPTSIPSPEPTVEETDEPAPPSPASLPAGSPADGEHSDTDDPTNSPGDHDRGHGNDPDGVDEDNPGNSSGLPDQENGGNSNSGGNNNQGGGNKGGGKK
jgi:hypothetical protein